MDERIDGRAEPGDPVLALGILTAAALAVPPQASAFPNVGWVGVAAVAASALGALFAPAQQGLRDRWVLAGALVGVFAGMINRPDAAGSALVSLCGWIGLLAWATRDRRAQTVDAPHVAPWAALAGMLAIVAQQPQGAPPGLVTTLLAAIGLLGGRQALGLLRSFAGVAALIAVAAATWTTTGPSVAAGVAAVLLALALPGARRADAWSTLVIDAVVASPARLLVSSFLVICAAGTALLTFPAASGSGRSVGALNAGFTAVSATCVTGLTVLDTAKDFSLLGQLEILLLIQVGGLGIMTFAAAALLWSGSRLSVTQEATTADLLGPQARRDLGGALRRVLLVTFGTEAVIAVALAWRFAVGGDTWSMALWKGVFTSISAFCNAGFFLHGSSLTPYAHDPWVLGFTSIAIMVGGLGPAVVAGLPQLLRGRGTLHGRLVIWTSLVLWIAPAVLIIALEWSHALAHLAPLDRVSNGIFHSVSLRTAGFNAIDLATVRPATWTILVICMFIGGSPGSTAGGAKTTTVALLVLAVLAAVRGQSEVSAFGRRIPHRSLYEATAVVSIGLASGVAVLFALQLTQAIPLDLLAFETVSALATVGLSTGATAQLDAVGKLIVMAAMFMGRVGPLSLFLVFADRQGRRVPGYPLESVQVG